MSLAVVTYCNLIDDAFDLFFINSFTVPLQLRHGQFNGKVADFICIFPDRRNILKLFSIASACIACFNTLSNGDKIDTINQICNNFCKKSFIKRFALFTHRYDFSFLYSHGFRIQMGCNFLFYFFKHKKKTVNKNKVN